MSWTNLVIAGFFEVFWAATMKMSNGFSKLSFSILTIIGMILIFFFLSQATKHLNLSIAYPVWTGIGAVGSIIIGVIIFKDQLSIATWFFVLLLLIGIIGIKFTS